MADTGLPGTKDRSADADVCSAELGTRRDWADGAYTVTCESCGTALREVTDTVSGDSVVLYRDGARWHEWPSASALSVVVDGRVPHPRGSGRARARGVHEREVVRDGAKPVRSKVRK